MKVIEVTTELYILLQKYKNDRYLKDGILFKRNRDIIEDLLKQAGYTLEQQEDK